MTRRSKRILAWGIVVPALAFALAGRMEERRAEKNHERVEWQIKAYHAGVWVTRYERIIGICEKMLNLTLDEDTVAKTKKDAEISADLAKAFERVDKSLARYRGTEEAIANYAASKKKVKDAEVALATMTNLEYKNTAEKQNVMLQMRKYTKLRDQAKRDKAEAERKAIGIK